MGARTFGSVGNIAVVLVSYLRRFARFLPGASGFPSLGEDSFAASTSSSKRFLGNIIAQMSNYVPSEREWTQEERDAFYSERDAELTVERVCEACGATEKGWQYNRCPNCGEMAEQPK